MSLRTADVIMMSSKMLFYCFEVKNAKSVSVNNLSKFEYVFIIFGRQHWKSNAQL